MPPLKDLASGVRRERVMTTSSGFFWVLFAYIRDGHVGNGHSGTHIADTPELPPGFRWFMIELRRSEAMVKYSCRLDRREECAG
jgi:hypothetical protein